MIVVYFFAYLLPSFFAGTILFAIGFVIGQIILEAIDAMTDSRIMTGVTTLVVLASILCFVYLAFTGKLIT